MAGASLNAARRSGDIDRLAAGETVDLVVIGGGVTGCGIALDAALRGLSTVLIERRDLANGTSRWSSKLIHGGLRYLRHFGFQVAWESARERQILMRTTAPHLVHALPFVVPSNDACPPRLSLMSEAGIRCGDLLRLGAGSRRSDLPGARRISGLEALRLAPAINRPDLRGALLFWDGQVEDDARLVIGLARTAARQGARILTYCSARSVDRSGVDVRDELNGGTFRIHSRMVVNATGVWAGEIDPQVSLQPSKGVHLVVRASALGNPRAAVITPIKGDTARWVAATPISDSRVLVGVTDDAYDGALSDEPDVTLDEERFLLDVLAQALNSPLLPDAVIGRYAGFRPLVAGASDSTADLSRQDKIIDNDDMGVTTIVGGKLTTYRAMAEKTLDHVLQHAGRTARPCLTARIPLVGAVGETVLAGKQTPERLIRRYGTEAPLLVGLAMGDQSLLSPIADGVDALGVELIFGVKHEGALSVDDLLDRRLRLGLVPAEREAALEAAQALFAQASA